LLASGKRQNRTGFLSPSGSGQLGKDIFLVILPIKRPLPCIQSALPIDRQADAVYRERDGFPRSSPVSSLKKDGFLQVAGCMIAT
jgi:hypothetical protein